jgi:(1->4)-alpha-D-glucan 1-alpha-D-glucosylmutase
MSARPIIATYRLQLRPGFGFDDAAAIVPYLAALGVSHLYLSPVFEAVAGSAHGYDIVDYDRLRTEFGGDEGFDRLVDAAHAHGLGIVLDIVPHHMAASADNAWWWSVLQLGEASPYARHFDIDWDPPSHRLRGTILLPVLGDHYGRVVESGELHLERGDDDALVVRYYDHVAPLSPDTADELWAVAGRHESGIEAVLKEVNADPDRLDAILDRQHHRFARWQTAAHELDYRRFFDIDSLVALRSERADVFLDCHRSVLRLVLDGRVDGLRVDHVDGLRDPAGYLERLRAHAPDAWIVVEKILRPGEQLPSWPIEGTTGYDFLAVAGGLFVDPGGLAEMRDAYQRFTAGTAGPDEVRLEARRQALEESLDADLERLLVIVLRVCEGRRRWRDFTRAELRAALVEVIEQISAYRSYVRPAAPVSDADRERVRRAIDGAAAGAPTLDRDVLDLLLLLFTGDLPGSDEAEAVARFQQLTGPVAAKGEEDTAFYRWTPLLSMNEVGSEPDDPPTTPERFHQWCATVAAEWPSGMRTTSTHDTKRSEDVRARLAVLSEVSHEWDAAVAHWSALNNRHRDVEADAPDRNDEWIIYQTLVGAHPLPFDRAWTVVEKSMREAKRRTSWTSPDENYERATRRFLESILADRSFRDELDRFAVRILEPGQVNALAQVALRLLAPGVPDTYQGTELWDDSLVDPDNRRPVDFDVRAAMLASTEHRRPSDLWQHERESGAPKLALVRACLGLRARHPDAFGPNGPYRPLAVEGGDRDHVVAFVRGDEVAVAVPRLPASTAFDYVTVRLPGGRWHNVLTSSDHAGEVPFTELRGNFPVAVLERPANSGSFPAL